MKKSYSIILSINLVFILTFSSFISNVFSLVVWSQTYGEKGSPEVTDLIETSDGGFALFGNTGDWTRHPDYMLIKTDTNGVMQWNQTYGIIDSNGNENVDKASCLLQTDDGGYLLAGTSGVYASGRSDIWLIKTDTLGNMMWNKTYGQWFHDPVNSIIKTSDGNFVLGGTTYSIVGHLEDFYVIKIDSFENLIWEKVYGIPDRDYGQSIVEASDGGYVLAGDSWSLRNGTSAYQLLKLDSLGNLEWIQIFGWNQTFGRYSQFKVNDLVKTSDGGYVIGGTARNPISLDTEFLLVKTDGQGNMQWNQTYKEGLGRLINTSDDGYAFAGQTYDDNGPGVFWIVKTDLYGIPEYPSWTFLPVAIVSTFVVIVLRKRFQGRKR